MINTVTWAALLGAGFGLSVWLAVNALMPAAPTLAAVMQPRAAAVSNRKRDRFKRALHQRFAPYAPVTDLRIIGKSTEEFVLGIAATAAIGLALPAVGALLLAMVGLRIGFATPFVVTLAVAAGFVLIGFADVKRKASNARKECRRAICSYLDLVATMHYNGYGAQAALMRAASLGQGWVFARIRETLLRAQLEGNEPWQGLRELGAELGVDELAGMGDIMQAAGVSGAHVYQSLRARARSLRKQVLSDQLTAANARTTAMEAPVALVLIVLMVLALYPYIATITVTPTGR